VQGFEVLLNLLVSLLQGVADLLMDEHHVAQVARPGTSLARPMTGAAAVSSSSSSNSSSAQQQQQQQVTLFKQAGTAG
jgi:hypothetical protein